MNSEYPNLDSNNQDSLNIKFLISLIQNNIKLIFGCAVIPAILVSIWSLQLPNLYTAITVLNTEDSESQAFSTGGEGLSLGGLRLGGGKTTKSDEAIEVIKSLKFFNEVILSNYPIEYFTGSVTWEKETNQLTIEANAINDVQAAHRNFVGGILGIGINEATGFTSISITHVSPYVATDITNTIVKSINQLFRDKETTKAEVSYQFMQSKVETTLISEIRSAFADIMKIQLQKLAYIESSEDYVFQTLSPAFPPNIKSGPFRSIFVLVAFFMGGLFGIIISYLRSSENDPLN
jgi:hypothetical protein